jgi:hypothetical protein
MVILQFLDQRQEKLRLRQGFTAGKSKSAKHVTQDICCVFQFLRKVTRCDFPTGDFKTIFGAYMQAAAEGLTFGMGAFFPAFAAGEAPGLLHVQLGYGGQPLRIVAPPASERTALHEHRGADAGTIAQGKALDIENCSCHNLTPFHKI